ncbi:UNVERIFIED_ORG: hypothetical protein FNL38_10160 [Nocardia globerula]|uniref:Uncharacterized protein n=1 Tax=Nocardia globerula TaxID=1818 RepID=A0A652YVG7_NOCGL|nr:hypothetical protein C8E04_1262 [Rhodococcus globerulus]
MPQWVLDAWALRMNIAPEAMRPRMTLLGLYPTLPITTTAATLGGYAVSAPSAAVTSDYTGKIGEHIMISGVLTSGDIATLHTAQSVYFGTP